MIPAKPLDRGVFNVGGEGFDDGLEVGVDVRRDKFSGGGEGGNNGTARIVRFKIFINQKRVNTKSGKRNGKLLPKNEEISGEKAHPTHGNLFYIFSCSQMSFSIRRE